MIGLDTGTQNNESQVFHSVLGSTVQFGSNSELLFPHNFSLLGSTTIVSSRTKFMVNLSLKSLSAFISRHQKLYMCHRLDVKCERMREVHPTQIDGWSRGYMWASGTNSQ